MARLEPDLVERVLARLGLARAPEPTLAGLGMLYEAWCRSVPFDNIRKLIHVRSGNPARLPGDRPAEFFDAWLKYGTGATCWGGNGALCELLLALGFDARRAVATMMVAPNLPPNHGSVSVAFGNDRYLVDASMLHVEPLPILDGASIPGAWGVRARFEGEHFTVRWNAPQRPEPLDCRIDRFRASAEDFSGYHEATRAWSPFNFEVHLRIVRGDAVIAAAVGHRIQIDSTGATTRTPLDLASRIRFLIDEAGIAPEIAQRVPADIPTPPPPGSRAAAR